MKIKVGFSPDAAGKVNLFTRQWLPEGKPLGIIQGVHGINEHSGRYYGLGEYLSRHGFVLAMHDQRGHGLSTVPGGRRGALGAEEGWNCLLQDVSRYGALLREEYPDIPIFLLGHSMGSFVVRDMLLGREFPYAGVILLGSASNPLPVYDFGLFLCKAAVKAHSRSYHSRFLRNIIFGGYSLPFLYEGSVCAWVSRLPEAGLQYKQDEFCNFIPSIGLFQEMFRGMKEMDDPANFSRIPKDIPMLILWGEQDPIGNFGRGMRRLEKQLKSCGCQEITAVPYPGARHELLHEKNTGEVLADIHSWIRQQIGA